MGYPVLTDVKDYLGIDPLVTKDDAYLTAVLAAVIEAIEQYCQRTFEKAVYTDTLFDLTTERSLHGHPF